MTASTSKSNCGDFTTPTQRVYSWARNYDQRFSKPRVFYVIFVIDVLTGIGGVIIIILGLPKLAFNLEFGPILIGISMGSYSAFKVSRELAQLVVRLPLDVLKLGNWIVARFSKFASSESVQDPVGNK